MLPSGKSQFVREIHFNTDKLYIEPDKDPSVDKLSIESDDDLSVDKLSTEPDEDLTVDKLSTEPDEDLSVLYGLYQLYHSLDIGTDLYDCMYPSFNKVIIVNVPDAEAVISDVDTSELTREDRPAEMAVGLVAGRDMASVSHSERQEDMPVDNRLTDVIYCDESLHRKLKIMTAENELLHQNLFQKNEQLKLANDKIMQLQNNTHIDVK